MSLDFEKGLYVRIVELERGPHPKPSLNGFSDRTEYRVLGMYNPSESGECWLVLANDRDEIWYISQRHVRVTRLLAADARFRIEHPDEADATVTDASAQSQALCVSPLFEAA